MKIKQITSLSLVLAMLVLSTSCGKSPSVNSNLPTPKSQASNLNQDLIPEESFSIYKWIKNHLLWATTVAVGATYVGINEWRHYSERKAIEEVDTKATTADIKAGNAVQTANAIDAKATDAKEIANGYSDQISNALQKAQTAQSNVAFLNNKLEDHIRATTNVHGIKAKVVPPQGVPGGKGSQKPVDGNTSENPQGSQKK